MSTESSPVTNDTPSEAPVKLSPVEGIKARSRQLRGGIAEELAKDTDHFSEDDKQLIKFHGSYQQEDRDARKHRKKEGVGKHYMFMVRCKIPGGKLTAKQYLAADALAGAYANGTLRFTSRQGIQFHGVLKGHLKDTIAAINECLLSSLGACGDVSRNVMACPAPHYHHGVHAQLQETASILAAHFAPRSRAYHEIWLNGKPIGPAEAGTGSGPGADVESLYGKVYLPRKFKTGLALPEDNCVDLYAQDLGLLAIVENGVIVGYNVHVGGGMGMTHGNDNTFPHLARPICYVPASAIVTAAESVVRLFRDHGNRADRKRARIKYLVHDWGVDKFRQVLGEYIGGELVAPRPVEVTGFETHLGWNPQGNGLWFYGLSVENGRVKDEGDFRLRTCLRTIVERYTPSIRLTPLQDILLCDLDPSVRSEIDQLLDEHGVLPPERLPTVQKYSMACPAIPTCGLAISESERSLPVFIDSLDTELKFLGLEDEKISVRMTGCPNGCVRPYQSDIGLVGRSGDKYCVFVGGNLVGSRLNFMLRDLVPFAEIVPLLKPLLERFKAERRASEGFGDYCQREGLGKLHSLLPAPTGKPAKVHVSGESASATNGTASHIGSNEAGTMLAPQTRQIPLTLSELSVVSASVDLAQPFMECETVLAGLPGEELRDHTYRYNSDGTVRETVVYFYGNDVRASAARASDSLCREAVYLGKADPARLHSARKLRDTILIGSPGHERRDRRIEYAPDGNPAQTVVFFYEGGVRAAEAPSGAAVRRQVSYEGKVT